MDAGRKQGSFVGNFSKTYLEGGDEVRLKLWIGIGVVTLLGWEGGPLVFCSLHSDLVFVFGHDCEVNDLFISLCLVSISAWSHSDLG